MGFPLRERETSTSEMETETKGSAIVHHAENPAAPPQNPAFDLGSIGGLWQAGEEAILREMNFHLDVLETPEFAQSREEGLVDRLLGTEDGSTTTTALDCIVVGVD